MRCLLCNNKLSKGRKKFCCNRHKDRFHNIHNPRGKFAHLAHSEISSESIENEVHPFDPEAFGGSYHNED